MSALWWDGFDTQDLRPYTNLNGTLSWIGGRFGGYAYNTLFGGGQFMKNFTASTEVFVGSAFSVTTGNSPLWQFRGDGGATQHITVYFNGTTGVITAYRGADSSGTLLGTSATGLFTNSVWQYFEARVKIHDTTGVLQIRVGGTTTNVIDFTGDTKNGGTSSSVDAVYWNVGSIQAAVDDIYIFNALGTVNNTWMGDCRVATLFPTAAGSSTEWIASTGANYTCVDEVAASSTDYVGSSTSGARDLYALSDLTAASIAGVKFTTNAHKTDTGAKSLKPAFKVGSTVYYAATMALTTSMSAQIDFYETSPATSSPWTPTEVNALEFGAEVV